MSESGSTSSIASGQSDTQSLEAMEAFRLENEDLKSQLKETKDQLKNAIKGRTGLWYISSDKTLHYVAEPRLEEGNNELNILNCIIPGSRKCTHFDFGDLKYLKNEDILLYLKCFGEEILSLATKYPSEEAKENLKDLLSKYAPNLEKLVIRTGSGMNSLDLSPLHLPKLKVLVLHGNKYLEMSRYILEAAKNLQRLELPDHIDVHVLKMLEEVDKLHCLKKFKTTITSTLINYWTNSEGCKKLEVESLELSYSESTEEELNVSAMVNQLLESSKNVIEELQMNFDKSALLGLVIPKLEKLRIFRFHPNSAKARMIPSLIDIPVVFPNLKEMSIVDSADRCYGDYIPPPTMTPITSIEVLRIFGGPWTLISTEALMKKTPNVKTLYLDNIDENPIINISDIFRAIFKNLPKLETFELKIHPETATYRDLLLDLEVAVSGLPKYFCKKMAEKLKNKDNLSADELALIQSMSRNASILDLKVLRKIDINIHCKTDTKAYAAMYESGINTDEGGYTETSKFYKTGFTKVSQLLIFDFIPTVEVSINKSSGH